MSQVKFWTQDKISYLKNNLHKGNKYLAKQLNVTETAIKLVLKRNKINKKIAMCGHNFYPQQDLITLLKNKNIYITKDLLIPFRKLPFIKTNLKSKKNKTSPEIVLFDEKSFNWLLTFFSSHTRIIDFMKTLSLNAQKRLNGFLETARIRDLIGIVKFDTMQTLFIKNSILSNLKDLLENFVSLSELSKLTKLGLSCIYKNFINNDNYIFFANKYYIHKDLVLDFIKKYSIPKDFISTSEIAKKTYYNQSYITKFVRMFPENLKKKIKSCWYVHKSIIDYIKNGGKYVNL